MKKILFISYYFPPCANSGSHRVLRLAKEIRKHNLETIVLTVKDGYWGRTPRIDHNLLDSFKGSVYRTKILYPYKHGGNGLIARIVRRIWSEMTFPEDKITWTFTAILKAFDLVKKEKIDCVFITGPPYSPFLIGYILKRFFDIPVCIDYRDPWIGSSYYIKRKWKGFLSRILEKHILSQVDKVYSATPKMTEFIKQNSSLKKIDQAKFSTLTYSFLPENYIIKEERLIPHNKFILTFAGSSFGVGNPEPLLKAILQLKRARADIYDRLLFICIGDLLDKWEKWIEAQGLGDKVQIHDYMPYEKTLLYMRDSDILLLPYSLHQHMKICLPVKIYDYFALEKPILYYGPQGQIWEIINETKTGYCRLPDDSDGVMVDMSLIYDSYFVGNKVFKPNYDAINEYRTDSIIRKFVSDIRNLLSSKRNYSH